MEGDIGKKSKDKYLEFNGVRITPKALILKNAYEGKFFREKIVLQNVSFKPVTIRTRDPTSFSFNVENPLHGVTLSCGLTVTIWINFTFTYSCVMQAQLPIFINDNFMNYDIQVFISSGHIYSVPRFIDFGTVNAGSSVHLKTVQLGNKGYRMAKFEFDLADNELDLIVKPLKGFIPAHGSTLVEIDFIGFKEGRFVKEIWIKCEHPFRISVAVNVITPKLYICQPDDYTECFTPIMFPRIYGACKCTESVVILNFNTLKALYIIVPEYNYEIMTFQKARQIEPMYDSFHLSPIDGYLEPNEKRKIKISFEPKNVDTNNEKVFFVFYRIMRLESMNVDKMLTTPQKLKLEYETSFTDAVNTSDVTLNTEPMKEHTQTELTTTSQKVIDTSFSSYIRICLYGVVKPVDVEIRPSFLNLGSILINTKTERKLILYNRSYSLPIYFQYKKVAFIDANPSNGFVPSRKNVEINVTISPKSGGTLRNAMSFELLDYNQPAKQEKEFVVVGNVEVQVDADVLIEGNKLKPKFNPGITPMITHEVGLLTDDVRFSTDIVKPRMAMIGCQKKDDALIAFPNDRPTSLRPWREKNVNCRTIFAAIPRLVTEVDEYNLSPDKVAKKQQNNSYYSIYINSLRRERLGTFIYEKPKLLDYEINEFKLLGKVGTKARPTTDTEYRSPIRNEFPLLTPIQIFFVKIKPTVVNIGKVLVSSKSKFKIYITNENLFRVKVLLRSHDLGEKSVFPNLPQHFILEGNRHAERNIIFVPTSSGRFNTILNVYLNNLHVQPILFQADVVLPGILLEANSIEFDDTNKCSTKNVNLYNILNDAVHFTWSVPSTCCFTVEPMSGTVPQNRYITCQIYYTPDFTKRASGKLSIICENGNTTNLEVTASLESCDVKFTESKINVPHIPLNITTTVTNTLRNYEEEDVLFSIKNPKPIPGITIMPSSGQIRGRSDLDLKIIMLFKAFVKFECIVDVSFQQRKDISFKICGSVDFPQLNFKPNEIQMKRISAESFDIVPFSVQNNGQSEIQVRFQDESFPELRVCRSMDINAEDQRNQDLKLKAGESASMFLHFFPLDVCMNNCYLPVIINGILGPAIATDKKSLLHVTYLENYLGAYDHENIEHLKVKHKIRVLSIFSISSRHILRFSKMFFKFKYHPLETYRSFTSYEIKIRNDAKGTVHFSIDIKDLKPHFDLVRKSGGEMNIKDTSMNFAIEPEADIMLNVNFIPSVPGRYMVNLPIYLKDYNDGAVFNYLQLTAKYHKAIFDAPAWVYLPPVPQQAVTNQDFNLSASYHMENCSIKTKCAIEQVKVSFMEELVSVVDVYMHKNLKVKLRFSSYKEMSFSTKLLISCSCGGECTVVVTGCADNSLFTTYAYQSTQMNIVPDLVHFPNFPSNNNKSEYAKYMRRVLRTTEKWLFNQVFYRNFEHFIPYCLSGIYRHGSSDCGYKQMLVLIRIMVNIAGLNILQFLINREIPENEVQRVNYYHATYTNVLTFLKTQGSNMPHVRARYLLSYADYLIYLSKVRIEKNKSQQHPIDRITFRPIATQSWLDLLLQIFKTMILSHVALNQRRTSHLLHSQVLTKPETNSESLLLSWCTSIFNSKRLELMELDPKRPEKFVLEPRTFKNFATDFSDGLALIAITIEHCPYLMHNLKNIYVQVDSPVKAFHNAALLQNAWSLIKTSFTFTPNEIAYPCPVHIIILLTYMYDVFPNLVPKDDISFRVNLSGIQQREITIRNPNTVDIFYEVEFLNNETNCFSIITEPYLTVKAGKSVLFKIRFQARKIYPVKAVILFSGDTPRQVYSKSLVYCLTGEPDFSEEHMCFKVPMMLYSLIERKFIITSPYPAAASYEFRYTYFNPTDMASIKLYSWKDTVDTIRPRALQTKAIKIECDENGVGSISVKLYCMSAEVEDIWIFFSNKDVGDFFLKISIQPTRMKDVMLLPVDLPDDWETSKCICKTNKVISPTKCPRRLRIKIPSRNDPFWAIVSKSMLYTVPIHERMIWTQFIESHMGPYLIKWLVGGGSDSMPDHIFNTEVKYTILNPTSGVEMPAQITIANIRSLAPVEIWMHVREDLQKTRKFIEFSLKSLAKSELRLYKIPIRKRLKKSTVKRSLN